MSYSVVNRIFAFGLLGLTACGEPILHDLDEFKANQVKVALAKSGISSEKIREGNAWKIEVGRGYVNSALRILEESRILKRSLKRTSSGSSGALIKTREERRSQLEEERAASLEETFESFPGVLEAHVHIFSKENLNIPLNASNHHSSASVLLIAELGKEIATESLKRIITGATGIPVAAVTVIVETVEEKKIFPQLVTPSKSFTEKHTIFLIVLGMAVFLIGSTSFIKIKRKQRNAQKLAPASSLPEEQQLDSADFEKSNQSTQEAEKARRFIRAYG